MKIRTEYIAFWILIALVVALALWKLFGSPTDTASIIAIALFIAGSEILIWKSIFSMDKKISLGFMKIKNDFDKLQNNLDNKLENLTMEIQNINKNLKIKRKWPL